ncbi:DNA gyrase subunit B [Myxococcus stipitatus DSM 14675]|uniref:DNA topoisomerase (ATP-hydrolyzing) n=1 Tax=Myxococcus stipitatus (strain DSM 14675 / JCM 12634 / Mx s8) TaxID=1278073 RepID=L7UN36_MYXSD|nr:DNA gyrase subunit B [Myxococcus stipitatus]AGC48962.1 DNA gyrase subunit B [Myxococcus stipitatus DSM 14675]
MSRLDGEALCRAIRLRPGMYVGDTGGVGKSRLVETLLMLGVMGARGSRLKEVSVTLASDGAFSVGFDGLPWPLSEGVSPFTELEQWLGFVNFDIMARPPRGMPHGVILHTPYVDLGVLNALSSPLEVIAWHGGQTWRRTFREGLPVESSHDAAAEQAAPASGEGLHLTLTPDPSIFEPSSGFSVARLTERLTSLSALVPASTWRLRDEVSGTEVSFRREHGLADLCAERSASSRPLHAPWCFQGSIGETQVSLALQWGQDPAGASIFSWANHESCPRGGTHHDGLYRGLRTALRARMKTLGFPAESRSLPDAALSERLTAVMSLTIPSTLWHGPVKEELANPEVRGDVSKLVGNWMKQALASHPDVEARLLTLVGVPRP